jgi:hypothetical protein
VDSCKQHETGRFLSPDWSANPTPVPYGNLGDPQSLNLYAYVGNNPLSGADVDGHQEQRIPVGGDGRSMYNLLARYNASLLAQADDFEIDSEIRKDTLNEAEEALEPLDPNGKVVPEWPPAGAIYPSQKGPLDPTVAKTFRWYLPWKLQGPMTVFRQWGGEARIIGSGSGTYYSLFPPQEPNDFMRDQMSLLPEWGNNMKNTSEIEIPAGTTVYIGPAAPEGPYSGGGLQVFLPR